MSYRIEQTETGECNTCGDEWTEGHELELHYDDPME